MPVYIIRAGDTENVKIGWADEDVEQRCKDLQVGCWLPLRVIRAIEGPRSLEYWLHRRFAKLRGPVGEWFTFDVAMLTVTIEEARPVPPKPFVPSCGEQRALLSEVLAFLSGRDISETTFGRLAVNDGKFVGRLRSGANMTLATIDKAREFMARKAAEDRSAA